MPRKTTLDKCEELLAEYENSHAKYEPWTVNGREVIQRTDHGCDLCVRARKLLDEDDILDEPA